MYGNEQSKAASICNKCIDVAIKVEERRTRE